MAPTLPGTSLFRATDHALRNRNVRRPTLFWCEPPRQIALPRLFAWRRRRAPIAQARYGAQLCMGLRPVGLSQCVERPAMAARRMRPRINPRSPAAPSMDSPCGYDSSACDSSCQHPGKLPGTSVKWVPCTLMMGRVNGAARRRCAIRTWHRCRRWRDARCGARKGHEITGAPVLLFPAIALTAPVWSAHLQTTRIAWCTRTTHHSRLSRTRLSGTPMATEAASRAVSVALRVPQRRG